MAIENTVTDEEFERELATKMKVRFWLRIIIGIAIGVICQLYYGWKGLFLASFVYGIIDALGILSQQMKIARLKVKFTETTQGELSAEERNTIIGEGIGKGAVMGMYSLFLVFATVCAIAAVTKFIASFLF